MIEFACKGRRRGGTTGHIIINAATIRAAAVAVVVVAATGATIWPSPHGDVIIRSRERMALFFFI